MSDNPYDLPLSREGLPSWLAPLIHIADSAPDEVLGRYSPPDTGGRDSAVLLLFAGVDGPDDADVLLIQRASTLNSHAGQPAFPGGAVDPGDGSPVGTAVREAVEETGVDPAGIQPFGVLPQMFLPVSSFVVTPVLAWWRTPSPVHAVDQAEVASVHRVALPHLIDAANRVVYRHPSGYESPGFTVAGLTVWGFTAGLLARLITLAGWEQPWEQSPTAAMPGPVVPPAGEVSSAAS